MMNINDLFIFLIILLVVYYLCRNFKKYGLNKNDSIKIKKLIRQTARWGTAAEQDINPYISNLHATYSLGYLMALREIFTDEEILKETGVDIRKLELEITNVMDNAIKKLASICPEGQPKNQFLAYLSKEGI